MVRIKPDGSRSTAYFEGISLDILAALAVEVVGGQPAKPKQSDRWRKVKILQQQPDLTKALKYVRDEPNEYGYYKAFEAICKAAGGEHKLWKRGWATRKEVESLRDSPQPKRHHRADRMPREPMTLPSMRAVLLRVARKLAEWVSAGRP